MADSGAGDDCKHEEEDGRMSDEESDFADEDSIYEVDKIVGISKEGDKTLYKVRWKGYGVEDDTWEPKENLLTCEDLIDEYVAKEEKKKATKGVARAQRPEKESVAPPKERQAPKRAMAQPKKKKRKKRRKYEEEIPAAEEKRDRRVSASTDEGEEDDDDDDDEGDDDSDEKEEIEQEMMPKKYQRGRRKTVVEEEGDDEGEVAGDSGIKDAKNGEEGAKEEPAVPVPEDILEVSPEALLKEPFWDQLEKGLIPISFGTDMYSKVKSRRAVLDARREAEENKQKDQETKEETKKRRKEKRMKRDKQKRERLKGHKKTKKMVDLEMLGSLESATKRTLMMSPSALDTSENSANLYRSALPSEQVLTIAQLEEKSNQERAASSGSGVTTPCKLESSGSNSCHSSNSNSSTLSQELDMTPDSPSSDKTSNTYAAFFGDLCKADEKSEHPDSQESALPNQLQDIADVLPTPEVDDADKQISDPVLTPKSPTLTPKSPPGVEEGLLCNQSSTLSLQTSNQPASVDDLKSEESCAVPIVSKGSPAFDKTLSNLPTPPEADHHRSPFTLLQCGGGGGRDSNLSQADSGSLDGSLLHRSLFNRYPSESQKHEYKVQEVNLFEKTRPPVGNVQTESNNLKGKLECGDGGKSRGDKSQEPTAQSTSQFQPPTPPASLFASLSTSLPKPSPLMPLSEGIQRRTSDLKSPLSSPTAPQAPTTSYTASTPSPKSYLSSQKSPTYLGSRSGERNAFEKLQSFQLSSAHGRNSAKVQSLKDKLSKLVSPPTRREEGVSLERGPGDRTLEQPQQQPQQQQQHQMAELRVDTSLANACRLEEPAPGQPQPLSEMERQIQRIDAQGPTHISRPLDRPDRRPRQDSASMEVPVVGQDVPMPFNRQSSLEGPSSGIPAGNSDISPSTTAHQGGSSLATFEALRLAITSGDTQSVVHMLQQAGPRSLEDSDSLGTTPLMLACSHHQDDIVKALILNGAIVNKSHKSGMTPLMMAAEKGLTSTVGILLEAGAYINTTTPTGESALMQACRKGHKDVVRLLLEFGANWMVTARDGASALGYALQLNHRSVQDILHAHVQRLCCELEATASQFLFGTARLLKSVFPLHCYRLREATEHVALISFDSNSYYCYQGHGMLLFLAHATLGPGWTISCKLSGSSYIKQVLLNGRYLPQLTQGSNFVLSYTPRSGRNVLTISTVPDPYTDTLLLVGAYTVQIGPHTAIH
ncbi:uncharacterized protein [Diadema antillarum]|uniref:uncharacterized protein n=1 Tax=Diadema antillarum TaxID=105358 RepID=UPI003A88B242